MIKYCPKCFQICLNGASNFCAEDGTILAPLRQCECGEAIPPYLVDKWCPNCGRKIDDDFYKPKPVK